MFIVYIFEYVSHMIKALSSLLSPVWEPDPPPPQSTSGWVWLSSSSELCSVKTLLSFKVLADHILSPLLSSVSYRDLTPLLSPSWLWPTPPPPILSRYCSWPPPPTHPPFKSWLIMTLHPWPHIPRVLADHDCSSESGEMVCSSVLLFVVQFF